MPPEAQAALGIAIAALGGAAVGVERQWSGHAEGHFAGIRTFTLLGALAGAGGAFLALGLTVFGAILLAAGVALVITAYVAVSRRDPEATTEVAGLVVLAAGALTGYGYWRAGSGIVVAAALLLAEKSALHRWVAKIREHELQAALRFAVMALIILPILPEGPYGPLGGIRPRELWAMVLFFSGLSFVGYIARVVAGPSGYSWAGLLGGLVSSTNVTLTFSRTSRDDAGAHPTLAGGVVAACSVLYVRVLLACSVLSQALAAEVWPYLAIPAVAGALATVAWSRIGAKQTSEIEPPKNPLQFRSALQMGVLFQAVLMAVNAVRGFFGSAGLIATALVLGLTDVDALTISMANLAKSGESAQLAAQAVAWGIASNNTVKLAVVAVVGRGPYRLWAGAGILLLQAATLGALLWM